MTVLRHLGRIQEARLALLRASRGRPPCFCVFLALSRLHASGLAQKCAIGQRRMDVCVCLRLCAAAQVRLNLEGSMQPVYVLR